MTLTGEVRDLPPPSPSHFLPVKTEGEGLGRNNLSRPRKPDADQRPSAPLFLFCRAEWGKMD